MVNNWQNMHLWPLFVTAVFQTCDGLFAILRWGWSVFVFILAYKLITITQPLCFFNNNGANLQWCFNNVQVNVPSCFVGLLLENCELPYENHGHVILADPSPILFYRISSTEIRCLVDVPGQKVPCISNGDLAKYLKTVVAPQVCIDLYSIHSLVISALLNLLAF